MPQTKTIYIDMDDVLYHTAQRCLKIIDREFGKAVAFEHLSTFDLGAACARLRGDYARSAKRFHRRHGCHGYMSDKLLNAADCESLGR